MAWGVGEGGAVADVVSGGEAEDAVWQNGRRTIEGPIGSAIEAIENELISGGKGEREEEENGRGQALGEHHWTDAAALWSIICKYIDSLLCRRNLSFVQTMPA